MGSHPHLASCIAHTKDGRIVVNSLAQVTLRISVYYCYMPAGSGGGSRRPPLFLRYFMSSWEQWEQREAWEPAALCEFRWVVYKSAHRNAMAVSTHPRRRLYLYCATTSTAPPAEAAGVAPQEVEVLLGCSLAPCRSSHWTASCCCGPSTESPEHASLLAGIGSSGSCLHDDVRRPSWYR